MGFGGDVASKLRKWRKLNAKVSALEEILKDLQTQAEKVMDLEPKVTELERLRNELQKSYEGGGVTNRSTPTRCDAGGWQSHQHESGSKPDTAQA